MSGEVVLARAVLDDLLIMKDQAVVVRARSKRMSPEVMNIDTKLETLTGNKNKPLLLFKREHYDKKVNIQGTRHPSQNYINPNSS